MFSWFFRRRRVPTAPPIGIPWPSVRPEQLDLAYRLVLGRPVDDSGLKHYDTHIRKGLSLETLIRDLLASDEYRDKNRDRTPTKHTPVSSVDENLVEPSDVIAQHSVEQLIETAEEYYRRIDDPTPLMSKPLTYLHEAPQSLHDLGLLLGGLNLGKTMTVLDFGGGTGWLSRMLIQLNCQAICCDVSSTALDIGRRLFAELPPIGTAVYRPQFLLFDGHHLALPSASVDRVICFDSFHHVPNQAEVLAEFARVLKPGGILGMSEPGRHHSESPQSQYEMKNHCVLENDIDLNAIAETAGGLGLSGLRIQVLVDLALSLEDYNSLYAPGDMRALDVRQRISASAAETTFNRSVFFLSKGEPRHDSRSHVGLAHELTVSPPVVSVVFPNPVDLQVALYNVGKADWLHANSEIFGTVQIGTHLFSDDGSLIELNYSRHSLSTSVAVGERVETLIKVPSPVAGRYTLSVDLVAEGVSWFENLGSKPSLVELTVS